jgi:predicted AlkP superfamily pyrophosphatase or phosphodiesterase
MKSFRTCLVLFSLLACPFLRAEVETAPIVILVSIDGCRWDYLQTFAPPTLTTLATAGVRAERMISCFPSSTFPNHYSIVTGQRPENHGMVANSFYDPTFKTVFSRGADSADNRWWGGEPIWVTASKQGLLSACMFWPGSEAKIAGYRPDLWLPFDHRKSCEDRTQQVLAWLRLPAAQRPHLITLYFDVVDTAGHNFGPATAQVESALSEVDAALGNLVAGIKALGLTDVVNFVITSDHGMAQFTSERRLAIDDYVDLASIEIDYMGSYALLRPHDGDAAGLAAKFATAPPQFHAYLREEMPVELHYRENPRIAPVVVLADSGWIVATRAAFADEDRKGRGNGGAHGYDPRAPDMGATFIASGPLIQSHRVIKPFENIHVYDLLCSLLNLQPAPNDGDHRLAYQVLKP